MWRLAIPISIILAIDFYAFQAFKTISDSKLVYSAYWFVAIFGYVLIAITLSTEGSIWRKDIGQLVFSFFLMAYIFKILLSGFLIIDDLRRLFLWIAGFLGFSFSTEAAEASSGPVLSRSKFLSWMGVGFSSIPVIAMVNGLARNAYRYQIKKVNLPFANLPEAFQGLKIVQLSDLHTGSFSSPEPIKKLVKMVNELKPDLVFFTGDLVNDKASEVQPYIDDIKQIKTTLGAFSVTGNHDYGDYSRWDSKAQKAENFELMKDSHKQMGWQLLLNENKIIEKDGAKLAVIGVENWGARHDRNRYGKLDKAYSGCEDCDLKMLLTHDPSHWRAEALKNYDDIMATFSGHTHGLQFGINIPGFKWSPVQYAYDEWMGLYGDKGRYLYVNPGLGFVGYPGRVGFLPEITEFTLVNKV